MSRSDSNFERSNISLKENKRDGLILTLMVSTTAFERPKEKFHGFQQTVWAMHWFSNHRLGSSNLTGTLLCALCYRTHFASDKKKS